MYASGEDVFVWGPIDSSVYSLDVKQCYEQFELKYTEFLETEEETFEFELIESNIEENENTTTN